MENQPTISSELESISPSFGENVDAVWERLDDSPGPPGHSGLTIVVDSTPAVVNRGTMEFVGLNHPGHIGFKNIKPISGGKEVPHLEIKAHEKQVLKVSFEYDLEMSKNIVFQIFYANPLFAKELVGPYVIDKDGKEAHILDFHQPQNDFKVRERNMDFGRIGYFLEAGKREFEIPLVFNSLPMDNKFIKKLWKLVASVELDPTNDLQDNTNYPIQPMVVKTKSVIRNVKKEKGCKVEPESEGYCSSGNINLNLNRKRRATDSSEEEDNERKRNLKKRLVEIHQEKHSLANQELTLAQKQILLSEEEIRITKELNG